MGPTELKEICSTFNLKSRELANALNVAPPTVTRWETGQSQPTGLQEEVLQALHNMALEVKEEKDEQRASNIRGLLLLGIGALIFYLLSRR